MPRFFASPTHIAETLGLTKKTVEKSITKLRKLNLWRDATPYSGRKSNPTGVGADPTGVGGNPTRVEHKKSFSPMKTGTGIERILEKNKKEGLESAASASPRCDQPQTVLKKLSSENSVSSDTQGIRISGDSGSEAPLKDCKSSVAAPPLGPTGKPLTKADMVAENFAADWGNLPRPYSETQIAAGCDGLPSPEDIADEFTSLFERKAG